MNFQQLRSVREAVRRGFNLTEVAAALHTSQPGVSRQIRELEEELGVEIFVRAGKRLTGADEAGEGVLPIVEGCCRSREPEPCRAEFAASDGPLTIAATHRRHATRCPMPSRVPLQHPKVTLNLHRGRRTGGEMLLAGEADVGIATEALALYDGLVALPCYAGHTARSCPPGHAFLDGGALTLDRLAANPIVTYGPEYTGRSHIDEAFPLPG